MSAESPAAASRQRPAPIPLGVALGATTSLGLVLLPLAPPVSSHTVALAGIATPYLAFAIVDGRPSSQLMEAATMLVFVVAELAVLDGPAWLVAGPLIAHAGWDCLHVHCDITANVEWWAPWCASFDLAMAVSLVGLELQALRVI